MVNVAAVFCYERRAGSEVLMSRLSWLSPTLLVIPFPALAQIAFVDPPKTVAPAKPASTKNDTEKLQCRMQDSTENRLGRHAVCLTKEQWAQQEQADKEMVRRMKEEAGAERPW